MCDNRVQQCGKLHSGEQWKSVECSPVWGDLDGNYVAADNSRLREERHQRYLAKPLHGQFFRSTENDRDDKSWLWLKDGKLKKETEGLITAAQDQALRTNSIKNRIDKQQLCPACGLCGERDETVNHIVVECKMLAQKYYKSWGLIK